MNYGTSVMYFEAKLSTSVKVITLLCSILILSALAPAYASLGQGLGSYITAGLIAIAILSLWGWLYCSRVMGYEIGADKLSIHRKGRGSLSIPLGDIQEADALKIHIISKTVRLWGSGGIWGYYGKFKTIGQPSFMAYVTDARNCVMLTLKSGKRIAISPHQRETFLKALSNLHPSLVIKTST